MRTHIHNYGAHRQEASLNFQSARYISMEFHLNIAQHTHLWAASNLLFDDKVAFEMQATITK